MTYIQTQIAVYLAAGLARPKWFSEIVARVQDKAAPPEVIEEALYAMAERREIECNDGRWTLVNPPPPPPGPALNIRPRRPGPRERETAGFSSGEFHVPTAIGNWPPNRP